MRRVIAVAMAVMVLAVWTSLAMADNHAVKIGQKEGVGKYLTDAKGMTLYWFKKDTAGKSACSGGCVEKWPLYYREKVQPPQGVKADDFGTITREDGKKQTTFRGYPLYYFANDKNSGDVNGNKVNEIWFAVDPDNFPPKG